MQIYIVNYEYIYMKYINSTCQCNFVFLMACLLQIVFNMSHMFYLNYSWH